MLKVKPVPSLVVNQPMSTYRHTEEREGGERENYLSYLQQIVIMVNPSDNSCDDSQPVQKKTTETFKHTKTKAYKGDWSCFGSRGAGSCTDGPSVRLSVLHSHNNLHCFFLFGFGFGHRTARIASSNTVFRPF